MTLLTGQKPLTAIELKEILLEIKNGEKSWKEAETAVIVASMMAHIGSTDSELRDKLIYTRFFELIFEGQLEQDLMIELLEMALSDEFLFKGIGGNGTDSVFTRTFTTLLIALILYSDNEDNFLDAATVGNVKDKLIAYIDKEVDLRGYVQDKGWAHAAAHAADAFEELVKNRKLPQEDYPELLDVLWNKIFISDYVYIHDEEERILIPILQMTNQGFDFGILEELIKTIPKMLKSRKEEITEEEYWMLFFNSKTFLKSFYMKINGKSRFISMQKSIENCLAEI